MIERLKFEIPPPAPPERVEAWMTEERCRDRQRQRNMLERALAAIPDRFRALNLDSPDLAKRIERADALPLSRSAIDRDAIVWEGPAGSGKTTLACAAARTRLETGSNCTRHLFVVSARKLSLARARHPLGAGEPAEIDRAMSADLLVLDDLGAEQATPAAGDAIGDVIHERYDRALATWVTTGKSADEIGKLYGAGVARRVFERAARISCGRRT